MSRQLPTVDLRVASVPAAHPYVAHLGLAGAGIDVLADPRPAGAPPGRWWPPVMLEADWISRHAGSFDVLHIHFGAESFSIAALSSALDALERAGRPLVFTVHDLENPQLADQGHHLAQLDLLITRAAELITLTRGAAAEIGRRWGRPSTVIHHPRMLAPELALDAGGGSGIGAVSGAGGGAQSGAGTGAAPAPPGPFTVGVHLRDLRPSIDGPAVTRGLAGAIDLLRAEGIDAAGRIALFENVRDTGAAERVRTVVAQAPHLMLAQQPRASEAALVADLSRLHVSLLPYRHGTHSGWAELCWDLAVAVVGAPVGYVAEQHDDPGWFSACDPADPASLAAALTGPALERPLNWYPRPGLARAPFIAARRERRDRQMTESAQLHRTVYLRALGR